MEIINHTEINREKWDELVKSTPDSLFLSSWYLDAVSPNWEALVWGDYESAFPLTTINKAGVNQVLQPIFTREFKVLGKARSVDVLLNFLQSNFKNVDLRFAEKSDFLGSLPREHQVLDLSIDFVQGYSTNAKRLIKKASKQFTYQKVEDLSAFFKLIEDTLVPKIEEFNEGNINKLENLMNNAQKAKQADCIGVYTLEDVFVGAGFFLKEHNKITYLKGAAINSSKKQGAMFGLLHFALDTYSKDYEVFDFGGSDIKNVADFYRKFGATNRIYYHYELNRLPFWYRWTKKFLRKA